MRFLVFWRNIIDYKCGKFRLQSKKVMTIHDNIHDTGHDWEG